MGIRPRKHPRFARSSRATVSVPEQPRTTPLAAPAPSGGVNNYDSLKDMAATDAIYSYNILPGEYGFRTRKGYREWVTTLGGVTNPVRTIIPYEGQASADDKLFVTTVLGIYDASSTAASPAIDTAFGTQTGNAGYGTSAGYNNDNGDDFLFYADEVNGLYYYNPATNTWAVAADITGVSEANLVFVVEHKNRIWFVERDTSNAWYLGTGVKGGAATKFALGNKFTRGGHLKGIYKWSLDGGDGIDDLLVFVSSAGEVSIYKGTDPASAATWQHVGTWFIGRVPTSRHLAQTIGGELHLLSAYGLISMQDLVNGVDSAKITGQNTIARKITRALRYDMSSNSSLADYRWDLVSVPSEGSMVITRPYDADETQIQYVFNFTSSAWGYWRGVPINCGAEWKGTFYFGDDAGNVHYLTGSLDGVVRAGTGGDPIEFSFLTAYSDLGAPGMLKRAQLVRPRFFSENGVEPSYSAKVLFDYQINEPVLTLEAASGGGSGWDSGLWDSDVWGGQSVLYSRFIGASGYGYDLALAIRGETEDITTYLDSLVYAEQGGAFL